MARTVPSATFTTEFGHEFEAERGEWLRRRFLWYSGVVVGVNCLLVILPGVVTLLADEAAPQGALLSGWIMTGTVLASTLLYLWAFVHVRRHATGRDQVLRLVFWLIVTSGVLRLVAGLIVRRVLDVESLQIPMPEYALAVGRGWMANVFVTHLFACLFLPWTPLESFRPLLPLLGLNAVIALLSSDGWLATALSIGLSPFIGVPGALICWYRHSRFREQFTIKALRGRYSEMKRELVDARRIHEALFPHPVDSGPVRFCYRYEPMRQIGGDYLYAFLPGGLRGTVLSLVVMDVTGHGIPAALTVNRLHGELERVFAEAGDPRPGDVLRLLNRYVHLTLATHSVYVTALCIRVDAGAGALEYASGGHPPAFLRGVDGTVEQLDSTSFVLGACADADFDPEPRTLRFGPGDSLIAYTDGATEARDSRGRFLGIAGIQRAIATGRADRVGGWAETILRAVEDYRYGSAADDTLVIEISRPVAGDEPAPPEPARRKAPAAVG